MAPRVLDLEFDEWNEGEMAYHRVTAREVAEVLANAPRFFRNKRGHQADLVMIGRANGGRLLVVPLARAHDEGVWRPATAWDAENGEEIRYRRAGGR